MLRRWRIEPLLLQLPGQTQVIGQIVFLHRGQPAAGGGKPDDEHAERGKPRGCGDGFPPFIACAAQRVDQLAPAHQHQPDAEDQIAPVVVNRQGQQPAGGTCQQQDAEQTLQRGRSAWQQHSAQGDGRQNQHGCHQRWQRPGQNEQHHRPKHQQPVGLRPAANAPQQPRQAPDRQCEQQQISQPGRRPLFPQVGRRQPDQYRDRAKPQQGAFHTLSCCFHTFPQRQGVSSLCYQPTKEIQTDQSGGADDPTLARNHPRCRRWQAHEIGAAEGAAADRGAADAGACNCGCTPVAAGGYSSGLRPWRRGGAGGVCRPAGPDLGRAEGTAGYRPCRAAGHAGCAGHRTGAGAVWRCPADACRNAEGVADRFTAPGSAGGRDGEPERLRAHRARCRGQGGRHRRAEGCQR
ncbi:hypothetical protein D3C71_1228380 [compost metagenome]